MRFPSYLWMRPCGLAAPGAVAVEQVTPRAGARGAGYYGGKSGTWRAQPGFWGGKASKPRPEAPFPGLTGLGGEAFAAAALRLDLRVAEDEGVVEALLHEVDLGAVDGRQALGVHAHA